MAKPTFTTLTESLIAGADKDGYPRHLKCDPSANVLLTIDCEHAKIHNGYHFTTDYTVELGNAAALNLHIKTPDSTMWAHMVFRVLTELESEMKIFEAPTLTNSGTALTVVSRNRNLASIANTTLAYHTPTIAESGDGTLIRTKHFGTGRTSGAESHGAHEWLLKQNESYLLRVTNATASVNWVTVILDWYESVSL